MRPLAILALASLAAACGGDPDTQTAAVADSVIPEPQTLEQPSFAPAPETRNERMLQQISAIRASLAALEAKGGAVYIEGRKQRLDDLERDLLEASANAPPEGAPPRWRPFTFQGQTYYFVPLEL